MLAKESNSKGNLYLKEEMKSPEIVNMWVNIKGKLHYFLFLVSFKESFV